MYAWRGVLLRSPLSALSQVEDSSRSARREAPLHLAARRAVDFVQLLLNARAPVEVPAPPRLATRRTTHRRRLGYSWASLIVSKWCTIIYIAHH